MEPLNMRWVKSISPAGTFLRLSLRERIEVREIFWFSSPAANVIDAFYQPPDLAGDVGGEIATFCSDLC
jgi:hypothetical protein